MPKKKLIELLIDEGADAFGVEAISLVKHPAIESNFVYFSKQERGQMVSLAKVDEEQRTLIGAALIPDKRIPRYDEFSDEEYDVYFSKQTCKQAAELFLKTHRTSEWTEEHENKVDGVHVVESWIVADPKVDKAHHFGLEVPEGTWMVRVQVENEEMWKFVKEQKVAGFSIEGYFLDKLEEMAAQPKPSLGRKLKSLVTGRKLYAEIEVDNGATFATEDEEFTAGVGVYKIGAEGTAVEVDNGTYKTKAGTEFEVYDGIVTEWDGQVKEVEEKDEEQKTSSLKEEYKRLYEKKLEALTLQTMSRSTHRRQFGFYPRWAEDIIEFVKYEWGNNPSTGYLDLMRANLDASQSVLTFRLDASEAQSQPRDVWDFIAGSIEDEFPNVTCLVNNGADAYGAGFTILHDPDGII